MSITRDSYVAKAVSAFVGIMMVVALFAAYLPLIAQAQTIGHTNPIGTIFARNLIVGSTGADVMALQKLLNTNVATQVAAGTSAGAPGYETSYFGLRTKAAVTAYQNMYASAILTPLGLTAGTGFFGASTRAHVNALGTSGPVTTLPLGCTSTSGYSPITGVRCDSGVVTPPTGPVTGGSVSIMAAAQPSNGVAPFSAARVPFTNFTVTAGSADVQIDGVLIERTGPAIDANLSGVLLLDETGLQVGIARTLNSDHQATVGEKVIIKAGTSRTFTVAGNIAASGTALAGQVVSIAVKGLTTSGSVSGTLPITGAAHTITNLTIGTVTTDRGAFDPGAAVTKEVGTTNYNFSSIKVTAGSAEDVWIKSIRWNQTGSAGVTDLANVVTVIDSVAYPTIVSSDGKFFSTVFPGSGLLIVKGASKDITIRGDIIGGSNRNVDFDIAKRVDLAVVGGTYGYGITPPVGTDSSGTDDSAFHTTDDYWWDASLITISTGSMTVSAWTGVPAQNIAENTPNQPLGGFSVDVKGEPISVGSLLFRFYEDSTPADFDDIDSVTLVDQTGKVVAGPVDAVTAGDGVSTGSVTFSSSITFPVGITNLTLKGKLGTDFVTNNTIAASSTPSTNWSSVTGQVTGNTITPSPTSAVSGNTMTIKAGSLTVSASSVPIAQTVIAGSSQFIYANYIFDATGSGEDLRLTSVPLAYAVHTGSATDLTGCKLYDGATVVNSSNVVDPTAQASTTSFIFDGNGIIVPRSTSKTFALKCNLRSGATGSYSWGIDAGQNATFTGVSGVDSGQTIAETFTDGVGQIMTAASGGTLTPAIDTNSPGYKIVAAGQTGVELARIKYSAVNEDIDLKQVALQLTSGASNTPVDLVNRTVTLWNTDGTQLMTPGGQPVTAVFPTGDNATSSQISNFRIPRDGSKVLVIKGDIAAMTASGPLTASGDLLRVDYDGDNEGINGNYGTGVSSGSTITPAVNDTASEGARIMKAYPVFVRQDVPSTTLVSGADKVLYRFKVTATQGDVAIYKFTLSVASSTVSATTTSHQMFVYTDSGFSQADTTFDSQGLLNEDTVTALALSGATKALNFLLQKDASTNNTYIVPVGQTRYFEFRATVNTVETGTGSESIDVALLGDAAYPSLSGLMDIPTTIDGDTNDDFIWSPISTTTQNTINDLDFTNGYQVSGLPSPQMSAQTFTSTN